MSQQITIKRHVCVYEWDKEKIGQPETDVCHILVEPGDSEYYINFGEVEITFTLPDIPTEEEIVLAKIRALEEERAKLLTEQHKNLQELDEKIQQLRALPNQTQAIDTTEKDDILF